VRLPSIDFDYRALSVHAVGQFLRLGHRRLALVVPGTGLAGNLTRERSFIEAVEKSGARDAVPVVLRHNGTASHIHSLLRTSVRGKTAPTAILVSHAEHLLSVLTHLLRQGVRVPEDISVVSSGDEWFLSFLTPTVACYRLNWSNYARRLSRMAVQLATAGTLAKRPILLIPQFQNGESLAPRR
jgi:DNA-binding LacI/PurR family transcriptional regulator